MSIKVKKDNLLINQIEITKNETCNIEGDCIVPDIKPDIINIIATSGVLSIHKKEISEGKIRVDGSITTYIMYRGNSGESDSVRSVNHILDFSQILAMENANSEMRDIGTITLKSIEGKMINERKIGIKAIVDFDIKLQNSCNVEFVGGIESDNLQKLENTIVLNSIIGMGNTKANVNEIINISGDEKIVEILKIDSKIENSDTKVSYNKVLIKADLEVAILYSTENGKYDKSITKFPIMGFVEIKDVTEDSIINPSIQISNFKLKLNGSQENSFLIDSDIEIGVVVYNNKKVSIIEDMYCTDKNLKINKKRISFIDNYRVNRGIYSINKKELLDIGEEKIYETTINIIINNTGIENDFLKITGIVKIDIINSANKMLSIERKTIDIPYEYKMHCKGIREGGFLEINSFIKNRSIDVISNGEIHIKLDIEFIVNSSNMKKIDFIESVEEGKEANPNKYNAVVYYTKKGDRLWNIAKEFGSTKNEIISENKLEGEEITPGMQLFITK